MTKEEMKEEKSFTETMKELMADEKMLKATKDQFAVKVEAGTTKHGEVVINMKFSNRKIAEKMAEERAKEFSEFLKGLATHIEEETKEKQVKTPSAKTSKKAKK
ncbi:hypothetical protein AAIR98_000881 [Elusimicrobium simillimum]|uniref:hypothetical protein n=1 Tax=Elusimicrobium simillimum TaxID=3143438 RepID=UPI003C704407